MGFWQTCVAWAVRGGAVWYLPWWVKSENDDVWGGLNFEGGGRVLSLGAAADSLGSSRWPSHELQPLIVGIALTFPLSLPTHSETLHIALVCFAELDHPNCIV